MIKTEMMLKYEQEIGFNAYKNQGAGMETSVMYGAWLEEELIKAQAKATAYDRLMSGNATAQEVANIVQLPIAMNRFSRWDAYPDIPKNIGMNWISDTYGLERTPIVIKIACDKDWGNSLTLPDGWEATDD